jgi:Methane oxygenase PmoA
LDHPANPGFPTYWHARGYGLFGANPLGRSIFTNGKEPPMNFSLAPHESATFRYRVLILSDIASADRVEAAYQAFVDAER